MSINYGDGSRPLLAICIPTFNRAISLRNLFRSLVVVKERFGDEIEICISNNASTDDTTKVIEEFSRSHEVVVRHQDLNIGATLNIISVAVQMNAHWGIWCGDDDEVDSNAIGHILAQLRLLSKETWVLVDSAGPDGRGQYLQAFSKGDYSPAKFRQAIMRSSLEPFGFMGVHIFPRSAVSVLQTLGAATRPWPPIICMLVFLTRPGAKVYVLHETPILQAKGGALIFWDAGNWARICLSRLRILSQADEATSGFQSFYRAMMLRELYHTSNLKLLVAWKLFEPADFDFCAIDVCLDSLRLTGTWIPFTLPHLVFVVLLRLIPYSLLALLFKIAGHDYLISRYAKRKQQSQAFDGINRGV